MFYFIQKIIVAHLATFQTLTESETDREFSEHMCFYTFEKYDTDRESDLRRYDYRAIR